MFSRDEPSEYLQELIVSIEVLKTAGLTDIWGNRWCS